MIIMFALLLASTWRIEREDFNSWYTMAIQDLYLWRWEFLSFLLLDWQWWPCRMSNFGE